MHERGPSNVVSDPALLSDKRLITTWIETQLRRFENALDLLPTIESGYEVVIGQVEIPTEIINVTMCVASLVSAPAAGAAYVRAIPVNIAETRKADYGHIILEVYNTSFALSTVEASVGWVAVGTTRID